MGRRKTDFTTRFPELIAPLARLPKGTALDGEIVHLTDGRPDFQALLRRERAWTGAPNPHRKHPPVTFVAFDLLYENFSSVMPAPLAERRERLAQLVAGLAGPRLALSDGQVGGGLALLEHAAEMGLEGVMAKRLDDPYQPGTRGGSWSKFKRRQSIPCVILGYQPNTTGGIKSLILAADVDGELRFVGQVGSGLGDADHHKLLDRLGGISVPRPLISCRVPHAQWARPDLLCRVSFAEWTDDGKLRQPVFEALL